MTKIKLQRDHFNLFVFVAKIQGVKNKTSIVY
jgi:hypothetical protein